jgi:hypothetical protein
LAVDTFREEAIGTLIATARHAAREVRQLMDLAGPDQAHARSIVGTRQGGDGDFDLPLDPLSET